MAGMIWQRVSILFTVVFFVSTICLLIAANENSWTLRELLQIRHLLLFVIVPYFLMSLMALWMTANTTEGAVLCIGIVCIGLWGLITLYDCLYVDPGGREVVFLLNSFMVFPVVFVQILAVTVLGGALLSARAVRKMRSRREIK